MTSFQHIAEAFSSHRFEEIFPHLAPEIRWVSVGGTDTVGRDAVVAVCRSTLTELAGTTTEFTRFVTVTGADSVAVDAIGRYTGSDGETSVVSSCDIYEFDAGLLHTITSYAVELAD